METLKALFGDWLPDLPDLDNPGVIEASGVVPSDGGYVPFRGLTTNSNVGGSTATLPSAPLAAIYTHYDPSAVKYVYAGTAVGIYRGTQGAPITWTLGSTATVSAWSMTQFDDLIIAATTNLPVQCVTLSSIAVSNLATSGTAPPARYVGTIARFVMIAGANSEPTGLQWSAIDEPRNWPTPGSSTATATQAGEQVFPVELGPITGIYGTDSYGIILQRGGVSRMQYIGGTVVFQFDTIDNEVGSYYDEGSVMVGGLVYFAAQQGFYVTDGVSVKSIGNSRIDKYFVGDFADGTTGGATQYFRAGYDRIHDVVYFGYGNPNIQTPASVGEVNKFLLYHRPTGRWSNATESARLLVTPKSSVPITLDPFTSSGQQVVPDLFAFNRSNQFCRFAATAGSATFITTEQELLPGKYSFVEGVKPLIECVSTAPAITVSIGSRNDQGDGSLTFTGTTTPTTATGFADFRDSARYHRAKVQITGEFKKATGLEFRVTPEGER